MTVETFNSFPKTLDGTVSMVMALDRDIKKLEIARRILVSTSILHNEKVPNRLAVFIRIAILKHVHVLVSIQDAIDFHAKLQYSCDSSVLDIRMVAMSVPELLQYWKKTLNLLCFTTQSNGLLFFFLNMDTRMSEYFVP